MRACLAAVAALLLAQLVGSMILLWARPVGREVLGVSGDQMIWWLHVSYVPGANWAGLRVRFDAMGRWPQVAYTVSSTEPWVPHWEGLVRRNGVMNDYPALEFEFETPEPMSAEVAKRIAGSVQVVIRADGPERLRVRFPAHRPGSLAEPSHEPLSDPRRFLRAWWDFWVGPVFEPRARIVR